MTDTRPHFWFQIIEEYSSSYNKILCAENLRDDVLYYYGVYENERHCMIGFDFTEYDDFYVAPSSDNYIIDNYLTDTDNISFFVIEENEYSEIMSIVENIGEPYLENILEAEPNLQYRISNIFDYPNGEGYIEEYTPSTVSWNINNKTVKNLQIGNKTIQTIERVSDGAIIYQKT